ncbi:hypothetical protein [Sporosarcina luteola]|nr:hypothetical protein [Sporosarcina luteola]
MIIIIHVTIELKEKPIKWFLLIGLLMKMGYITIPDFVAFLK